MRSSLVLAILAGVAACAHQPQLQMTEETPPARTADDPALHGAPPSKPIDAGTPGSHAEGSITLDAKTTWTPLSTFDLAPNTSQKLSVSFSEGVVVFARAIWQGSQGPVNVVVSQAGTTLASAKPVVGSGHGAALAQTKIPSAGSADILVTNAGNAPVSVRVAVGTLPLSVSP